MAPSAWRICISAPFAYAIVLALGIMGIHLMNPSFTRAKDNYVETYLRPLKERYDAIIDLDDCMFNGTFQVLTFVETCQLVGVVCSGNTTLCFSTVMAESSAFDSCVQFQKNVDDPAFNPTYTGTCYLYTPDLEIGEDLMELIGTPKEKFFNRIMCVTKIIAIVLLWIVLGIHVGVIATWYQDHIAFRWLCFEIFILTVTDVLVIVFYNV